MNDIPNQLPESERPTVKMILKDWVDTEDLGNVMDYDAITLLSIAYVRNVVEDPGVDDYIYWCAVEYVYKAEKANYDQEKINAETHPEFKADSSWIEYMTYEQLALEVLKAALDQWSQNEFGTPYTED